MKGETGHQPVLVGEALDGLALVDDGWYVDATYGRGGHSAAILARLSPRARLLALDKDPAAVADGRARFAGDSRFAIEHAGFEEWSAVVDPWRGGRGLAGALFDLGVSSPQLEEPTRGFSFGRDGPLDMRMNNTVGPTAAEWLRGVGERELAATLRDYGEEPHARRIAAAIVRRRAVAPLATTRELAELVAEAAPRSRGKIHPATRVFQAIRIAVNQELTALERGLEQCIGSLRPGGRLVAISFHSLEDRIVKRFIQREARGDERFAGLPSIPEEARPRLRAVGRLVRPSDAEVAQNPRARSARLRIAERTAARHGA